MATDIGSLLAPKVSKGTLSGSAAIIGFNQNPTSMSKHDDPKHIDVGNYLNGSKSCC